MFMFMFLYMYMYRYMYALPPERYVNANAPITNQEVVQKKHSSFASFVVSREERTIFLFVCSYHTRLTVWTVSLGPRHFPFTQQ